MHLTTNIYLFDEEKINDVASLLELDNVVDGSMSIDLTLIYWRKANHIHNWFVKNVQHEIDECEKHHVNHNMLTELRDVCAQVLKDPKRADELLPVKDGFFFGSTVYDERYMSEVARTHSLLDRILNHPKLQSAYIYYCSIW